MVLGARRTGRLEALKKDIEAAGGVAAYKETDVVSRDQVVALIKTANDTFGPVRLIRLLLLLFVLFIYLTNRAWLGHDVHAGGHSGQQRRCDAAEPDRCPAPGRVGEDV